MEQVVEMAKQVDQAIAMLAQAIGEQSPEAAQGLQQVQEQFRQVIEHALGGEQQEPEHGQQPMPSDPHSRGQQSAQQKYM